MYKHYIKVYLFIVYKGLFFFTKKDTPYTKREQQFVKEDNRKYSSPAINNCYQDRSPHQLESRDQIGVQQTGRCPDRRYQSRRLLGSLRHTCRFQGHFAAMCARRPV